ncbi:glycosyltransferase [Nocardioides sp. R-C-SC26]|uniref:glycosyltransferase family 2 protein n=1 Tax=Nocardioides sp. R-C-SC26 TaxID=2870414 RepID=UPI001E2ABCF1|nr:glycosyltransferase [Nocardioides sp. R-C-SC26]
MVRGADIPCREGDGGYDVRWPWNAPGLGRRDDGLTPGLTCVFRVKNEARNLPWVLPPMFAAVDHVVLVDNESDDGTLEVASKVAADADAGARFTGTTYPWRVSRAGAEHLATPPDSVHSLTHFYNWSFAHVRTTYSMKWDGDMVLTPEGVGVLRDLAWQLQGSGSVVAIPRHPLSIVSEREAWIDLGFRFLEPWIYPMGPDFTYVKAFEWEVREFPTSSERIIAPEGLVVELKWIEEDEFAHWTSVEDFANSRVPRKRREWEVYTAIMEGTAHEVPGLHHVVAPEGVHVVDHVVNTWLRTAERPLVRRVRES